MADRSLTDVPTHGSASRTNVVPTMQWPPQLNLTAHGHATVQVSVTAQELLSSSAPPLYSDPNESDHWAPEDPHEAPS